MRVAPWSQVQLYVKGLLKTLQIDQWPYAVSVVLTLRFTLGHCAKVQGSSFSSLLFFFPPEHSEAGFRITEIYCGNLGLMKVWMNLTLNFCWFWRERSELFFWGSRCVHKGLFQLNVQTAGVVDLSFWYGKRHELKLAKKVCRLWN